MILYVITWATPNNTSVICYPPNIIASDWYDNIYNFCEIDPTSQIYYGVDEIETYLTANSWETALLTSYLADWRTDSLVNATSFANIGDAYTWLGTYKLSNPTFIEDYATWQAANNIITSEYWFEFPGNQITHTGLF
jgi:hypothetical protein